MSKNLDSIGTSAIISDELLSLQHSVDMTQNLSAFCFIPDYKFLLVLVFA